ncbi:SH3 and multiple ankyrin repeat domains protein 3-like isoform X2 [Ascaphus truei]|uniref:SH3 and multiple ankyrin repeat domains protein 3-like isoform X2 n=1 Tax=Ascaphus truei TaxID=8439 RepID=UPI003F59E834
MEATEEFRNRSPDGCEQDDRQKCLRLNPDTPVWVSKQRILCTLNHSLKDVLNYGLFQPAFNGRAGKFLDEERLLREYPPSLATPVPYLEFRYKRRVYTQTLLDDKQFAKLHTKGNLKKFMDYIQLQNIEKVTRLLERGLDPNYQDPDMGECPLTLACPVGSGNGAGESSAQWGGLTSISEPARD